MVAVDPGALHPSVLALPGVHHLRVRSEDAVGAAAALMAGGAGGGRGSTSEAGAGSCYDGSGPHRTTAAANDGMAELLVSDMNMHPYQAMQASGVMCALQPLSFSGVWLGMRSCADVDPQERRANPTPNTAHVSRCRWCARYWRCFGQAGSCL